MTTPRRLGLLVFAGLMLILAIAASAADLPRSIDAYRDAFSHVAAISDTTIIAEAEEFAPAPGSAWMARPWGQNYYAATLANTFLSRKAFLGADELADGAAATRTVEVPADGQYLALVRYEAAPRFQTQFRLRIAQEDRVLLDRLYGARENVKIWPFGQRLKPEAFFSWGACENIVWEGHDAAVTLRKGPATLTLVAVAQPAPRARRHIDLVLLTSDIADVRSRIEKENYLPLDGLLTQTGDLYVKLHNQGAAPLTVTLPPGIEHSPYWVHRRTWTARTLAAAPAQSSDWTEVGSLLDSLNDGQWRISARSDARPNYTLEFAVKGRHGNHETIGAIPAAGASLELAYCADTRYSRRITTTDQVLYDLVAFLKANPVAGRRPTQTLIYGTTFPPRPDDPKYTAALDEFVRLIGATALNREQHLDNGSPALLTGYIDLRDKSPDELRRSAETLRTQNRAGRIAVVSLGDEISLPSPAAADLPAFHDFLRSRGLRPRDVHPPASEWSQVPFSADADPRQSPALYYYSRLFRNEYGIAKLKSLTEALRPALPNAGIGANYSPHHGYPYLGSVAQWVSVFRASAMTMPWTEDYIWQSPVGSQQMHGIVLDLLRAGLRDHPDRKLHSYVMPHHPGNTPRSFRRMFYLAAAHGVKIFNLFEFRPVQVAYTENHVSSNQMYQEVRRCIHELGVFEDLLQAGRVRPAPAAVFFSETADIWNDNQHPFAAAKRTLYIAARHQQLPLNVVVDGDDLGEYAVLFLADRHVSSSAARAIAAWVAAGGRLFATAGAGAFDELDRPNATFQSLYGFTQAPIALPADPIRFEKQDLPFTTPIDHIVYDGLKLPIINLRAQVALADPAPADLRVLSRFSDGAPAILTRRVGKGSITYCAFLPGLSYFHPAIPLRPVDRGASDDAMAHLVPGDFDPATARLFSAATRDVPLPVTCSDPLVETAVIQSPKGLLIPLINWTGRPQRNLTLTLHLPHDYRQARLASGGALRRLRDARSFELNLDAADALILQP